MARSETAGPEERRLLLDITLAYRSLGHAQFGMLRVEREFVRAALRNTAIHADFCHYDKFTDRFYAVESRDVAFITDYLNPSRIRRLTGRRNPFRDVLEILTSRRARRYCSLRWNLRRFLPSFGLRRQLDERRVNSSTTLVLLSLSANRPHLDAIAALARATRVSIYFLCHDMIPIVHPEYFAAPLAATFRRYIETLLPLADGIGAVSKATRGDLLTYARSANVAAPPISIVRLGTTILAEPPSRKPETLPSLAPGEFVLCVGNINIRKNHALLYRVWAGLGDARAGQVPTLVVAGEVGWMVDDLLVRMRTDPRTRDSIVLLHDVDDRSLAWLYANCLFTLYPSLYEGWGLPVSESLAYGKYCLAASNSSLPEAGAGLAGLIDAEDDGAWESAITDLLDDPAGLRGLEAEIRRKYKPLSWPQAGEEFFGRFAAKPIVRGGDEPD